MVAQHPIPEQLVEDDLYMFNKSDSSGSEGMSTTKKNKAAEREQDREQLRLDQFNLSLPLFWEVIGDTRYYKHNNRDISCSVTTTDTHMSTVGLSDANTPADSTFY
jgi:hypothetical protein